jgi:uncharacterized protein (TIGR03382 family)
MPSVPVPSAGGGVAASSSGCSATTGVPGSTAGWAMLLLSFAVLRIRRTAA